MPDPDDPLDPLRQRLAAVGRCPRPPVMMLGRALEERYEQAFAAIGMNSAQFTLLSAIGYAGESPITGLTRYVARDQTTLSRGVEKLRRRGWVEVVRPPDNKRIHLVRLAPEGVAQLERAMDAWERVRAELDERLGSERVEQLVDLAWAAHRALREP